MAEMILRASRSTASIRPTESTATTEPGRPADLDGVPVPGRVHRQPPIRRTSAVVDPLGGTEVESGIASTLDRLRGHGIPLSTDVAGPVGAAMGVDLAGVSIHADAQAHRLSRTMQARAFTHGSDIYFDAGSYAPHTARGRHLLSHELAHVAQNRATAGLGGPLTVGRADDPAEVEAEAAAHRIRRVTAGGGASIRRAGDKIAFQAHKAAADTDQGLVDAIGLTIKAHQSGKRRYKSQIETAKDKRIEALAEQEDKAVALIPKGAADFKEQRTEVQEPFKADKVAALKEFHQAYTESGWNLVRLQKEILEATKNQVTFGKEADNEIPVTSVKSGNKLYSIFTGGRRFDAAGVKIDGKDPTNPVFGKKGTTKEYVQDVRGLFIGRYVYRGCSHEQMVELFTVGTMHPRNRTDVIGKQFEKFKFGTRGQGDKINQAEREYLQQRDGSGEDQRMLSVTHAKKDRKVYSNHGELFTSTATIKIDLAKIDPKLIADIHLTESHQYKTSLARKDLNKSAQEELQLYVYSAEKNRESLLLQIPEAAVVEVGNSTWNPETKDPKAAKRFYNSAFNKQELEREKKERQAQEEKDRLALEAQRAKREAEEKAERKKAEAEKKDTAERTDDARRTKVISSLREIYENNKKKFRQQSSAWAKFDDDPDGYLTAYESQKKKLNPSLVMMSDLTDLLKTVK